METKATVKTNKEFNFAGIKAWMAEQLTELTGIGFIPAKEGFSVSSDYKVTESYGSHSLIKSLGTSCSLLEASDILSKKLYNKYYDQKTMKPSTEEVFYTLTKEEYECGILAVNIFLNSNHNQARFYISRAYRLYLCCKYNWDLARLSEILTDEYLGIFHSQYL